MEASTLNIMDVPADRGQHSFYGMGKQHVCFQQCLTRAICLTEGTDLGLHSSYYTAPNHTKKSPGLCTKSWHISARTVAHLPT
eukprot:scaffold76257_cov17-Tisochrysis_lutea.AAC.1